MRQSWGEFLRGAGAGAHGVQVYAEASELADSVAAFVAGGLDRDEPVVLVVTPDHLGLVQQALEARGRDLAAAEHAGLLHVADAETTLAAVAGDGAVDDRFDEVVGGLLDRAVRGDRPVRVFGEMVDLLCRRGDVETANELEHAWNALAAKRRLSLLCGYRLDVFASDVQLRTLPHVCRAHSHVMPVRNYPRFARAVDEGLREVLGPNKAATVYVLVSRLSAESHVPLAQLILMWVSENLPHQSTRILETARARYARSAA